MCADARTPIGSACGAFATLLDMRRRLRPGERRPMVRLRNRLIMATLGALGLAGIVTVVLNIMDHFSMLTWDETLWYQLLAVYSLTLLGGGALVYALEPMLRGQLRRFINWMVHVASDRPLPELLLGLTGAVIGMTIAFFISTLISGLNIGVTGSVLSALIYITLGTAGYALIGKRWNELPAVDAFVRAHPAPAAMHKDMPKLLDTSVLIDGRVLDIMRAGFIDGPLVLPQFMLEELQRIADSPDPLRRNRGRRGLDIVRQLQEEAGSALRIDDTDFADAADVDIKLLKLAREMNGRVVTNDFNLSKVASVTGIGIMNINELAEALRPVLLPGEELTVRISREGREPGQGVAYMDDGTMIVVENGRRHIGQSVCVSVSSVLKTASGRMIFARINERAAG